MLVVASLKETFFGFCFGIVRVFIVRNLAEYGWIY